MINIRLKGDENELSTSPTNDFRQIALIKDPKQSQGSNVMIASAFTQAYTFTLLVLVIILRMKLCFKGGNANNSTFSGRVVSWEI
jgi:hypothetical protein